MNFQICQCGMQPGYPHPMSCPFPYYGHDSARIAEWERVRALQEDPTPLPPDDLTGRRLASLTPSQLLRALRDGNVLQYSDMANPPSEFTITGERTNPYGNHLRLVGEDGREIYLPLSPGSYQHGWIVKRITTE